MLTARPRGGLVWSKEVTCVNLAVGKAVRREESVPGWPQPLPGQLAPSTQWSLDLRGHGPGSGLQGSTCRHLGSRWPSGGRGDAVVGMPGSVTNLGRTYVGSLSSSPTVYAAPKAMGLYPPDGLPDFLPRVSRRRAVPFGHVSESESGCAGAQGGFP